MEARAKKYIAKVADRNLTAFMSYWIQYEKPCSLLWRKPKTEGFTAVIVTVDNGDAALFMAKAVEDLEIELRETKL